jgi:hypothetical protein
MRFFLIVFLLTNVLCSSLIAQNTNDKISIDSGYGQNVNPTLELIPKEGVKQLVPVKNVRFDLSGMVLLQDKIIAIADKDWDKYIYQIEVQSTNFDYIHFIDICPDFELDIEGIDFCNNHFYLLDEGRNEVYEVFPGSCKLNKLIVPWDEYGIERKNWGNKGFEGIAIDGSNQIMYLAKEREPRRIFEINLKNMAISEPFIKELNDGGGHDISELKYENGFLYILERGLGQITRLNIKTKEKVSVTYQNYVFKNGQRWFKNQNPQYGMAEAFILKENEIWLGIDNNGDPVSKFGKDYGLKDGINTAILVFIRPKGF